MFHGHIFSLSPSGLPTTMAGSILHSLDVDQWKLKHVFVWNPLAHTVTPKRKNGANMFFLLRLYLHQGWSLKRFCVSYLRFWYGCQRGVESKCSLITSGPIPELYKMYWDLPGIIRSCRAVLGFTSIPGKYQKYHIVTRSGTYRPASSPWSCGASCSQAAHH